MMATSNFTRTSGQSPTLDTINAALRAAAMAPTVFDALDVTGEALRRLAEIPRAEASQ